MFNAIKLRKTIIWMRYYQINNSCNPNYYIYIELDVEVQLKPQ